MEIKNWKTQIRKGYLELCLLTAIKNQSKAYGFGLIEQLHQQGLEIKEGTLYPLLNRLVQDGILKSRWVTEDNKGSPKKFYSLSTQGEKTLDAMKSEFERMNKILKTLSRGGS